jgi:hypothetical protein
MYLPPEYAALHPSVSGGRSKERELLDRLDPKPPSQAPRDGMNKTERAFAADVLDAACARHEIARWWREPVKLRLAGRTFYTPDFLVMMPDDRLVFGETKGRMREDAAVKIKVATELYPCFGWLLVYREGRHGWRVHRVTAAGIGIDPIEVPWIHGSC